MIDPTYDTLETRRAAYRDKMPVRDGCTPDQQIAMATIHNQQVARGSCLAIAVLLSKPTLRALVGKGLIGADGALTRKGDDLLKKWWKGD